MARGEPIRLGDSLNQVVRSLRPETGPAAAPAAVMGGVFGRWEEAVGVAVALQRWNAGADEREFWALCARERVKNPKMTCEFTA